MVTRGPTAGGLESDMWRVFLIVLMGLAINSVSSATAQERDGGVGRGVDAGTAKPMTIRIATFNIEDTRTDDLKNLDHPRLKQIAAIIQRLRPNVILINEIAYDEPGSPGFVEGDEPDILFFLYF